MIKNSWNTSEIKTVCVSVCYDELVDEAVVSTNLEPSKTTEQHADSKKVEPVTEEKPLKQGTNILHLYVFFYEKYTVYTKIHKIPFWKHWKNELNEAT